MTTVLASLAPGHPVADRLIQFDLQVRVLHHLTGHEGGLHCVLALWRRVGMVHVGKAAEALESRTRHREAICKLPRTGSRLNDIDHRSLA